MNLSVPYPRRRVKDSLKYATLDGAAFSAMAGLTQNYITPFALALKATTLQIGLLSSVPNLMMALSQLAAPNLTERAGSRKGLILPVVFAHALLWIPLLLVPFIFPEPKAAWVIILITIGGMFGSLGNPAWGSMMADLVPMKIRGRYFSFRARTIGLVALAFSFAAGGILEVFSGNVFTGFVIIFGSAAFFRFCSFYFLSKMHEPERIAVTVPKEKIIDIVKHVGTSNLGRFTLFVALIGFATSLAGPFFSVYMLRDLGFSYTTYMLCASSNAVANLAFQTFWGKRADRFGNSSITKITACLMPVIPLLWLFNNNPFYLMGVQMFAGIVWSGFTLATTNYLYDATDSENRAKYIAVFNAANGIASCIGALLAGYVVQFVPVFFNFNLQTMFLISGLARGSVVLFLLKYVLEVRKVPKKNPFQVIFSNNGRRSAERRISRGKLSR